MRKPGALVWLMGKVEGGRRTVLDFIVFWMDEAIFFLNMLVLVDDFHFER